MEETAVKENENAIRLTVLAPDDKCFFTDELKIKSIKELSSVMESFKNDTFQKYVNGQKNDFYNWIIDVFARKDIAESIKNAKAPKEIVDRIEEFSKAHIEKP